MKVENLKGVIDLHVHTAPDLRPRLMNDVEMAKEAAKAGMRAILLKSHFTLTADRAWIAEKLVGNVHVFGGLVLNHACGGLNPAAVEAALAFGAKEIWMPTVSAANNGPSNDRSSNGISILGESGRLIPVLPDILKLIAEHDAILGTGHLSVVEIRKLVKVAQETGVRKILITHPELPIIGMPSSVEEELRDVGAFFERCLISTILYSQVVSIETIAHAIRRIGPETTVLSTDLGQPNNPSPVQGMRDFITGLLGAGIASKDIDLITKKNPSRLLDLD